MYHLFEKDQCLKQTLFLSICTFYNSNISLKFSHMMVGTHFGSTDRHEPMIIDHFGVQQPILLAPRNLNFYTFLAVAVCRPWSLAMSIPFSSPLDNIDRKLPLIDLPVTTPMHIFCNALYIPYFEAKADLCRWTSTMNTWKRNIYIWIPFHMGPKTFKLPAPWVPPIICNILQFSQRYCNLNKLSQIKFVTNEKIIVS